MRATESIDLAGGSGSISPTSGTKRVKVHGVFDTNNLYRSDPDVAIIMDNGTIEGGTANGEYTKFQALDTFHLVRAMTYKASGTISNGGTLTNMVLLSWNY